MATKYLNRHEAAAYITAKGLACSFATLQKYATVGGGPLYRKFGNRVVYTEADLDAWIEQKLGPARASSSEILGAA
ncbi:MAG: DNA-binding protein [Geminicoccaceae bacterium]|nr:MAG: DNA-binding protein [Geminicoccaceae bacterium]